MSKFKQTGWKLNTVRQKTLRIIKGTVDDGRNPKQPAFETLVNNGINYQAQLVIAGFLPSTLSNIISFLFVAHNVYLKYN